MFAEEEVSAKAVINEPFDVRHPQQILQCRADTQFHEKELLLLFTFIAVDLGVLSNVGALKGVGLPCH